MKEISVSIQGENSKKEEQQNSQLQKKLKKIDTLKKKLKEIQDKINSYRVVYNKEIIPEMPRLYKVREQYVVKLFSKYKQSSFSRRHHDQLLELIGKEMEFLSSVAYSSKVLEDIYEEIKAIQESYINEDNDEMINDFAKAMMEGLGFDIDDDETFDFSNFEEKFEQKYKQQQKSRHNQYQEEQKAKKLKHTDRDFYKLYKSLAKKAHPDLVTEPNEKQLREDLMKRLSEAWSTRNYVQLLSIQQELGGVTDDVFEIQKSQYKSIIKQLDEELKELEEKKYVLTQHDYDTAFFYQNFHSRSEKALQKKIASFKENLEEDIAKCEFDIFRLKTQKTTKQFLNEMYDPWERDDFLFYE